MKKNYQMKCLKDSVQENNKGEKMELLMTGDIYIKRNPDYVECRFEEIEENIMIIEMNIKQLEDRCEIMENIKSKSSNEDWWKDSLSEKTLKSTYKRIENLNQKKIDIIENGKPIYNGYYNFWVSIINEYGIKMVEQSTNKKSKKNL